MNYRPEWEDNLTEELKQMKAVMGPTNQRAYYEALERHAHPHGVEWREGGMVGVTFYPDPNAPSYTGASSLQHQEARMAEYQAGKKFNDHNL